MDSGYYSCQAEYDGLQDEVSTFIRHIGDENGEIDEPYLPKIDNTSSSYTAYQPRRDPERISRFTSKTYRKGARDRTPRSSRSGTPLSLSGYRSRSLTNEHSRTPERYYREENRYSTNHMRPKFSTYLTDRLSTEGSACKLTCNVIGNVSNIRWFKNNIPISDSSNCRSIYDNGLATLEIFNAKPTDSGNYTCVVRNEHGESSTASKLKVYHGFELTPLPPVFTRSIRGNKCILFFIIEYNFQTIILSFLLNFYMSFMSNICLLFYV